MTTLTTWIFGQEDGPGNASQLHHGTRADSTANMHYGGWGNSHNDAGTIPTEEWTHVAWSFDGTNKIVFVSGIRIFSEAYRRVNDSIDAIISLEVSPSLGTTSWDGSGTSHIFVSSENNPDGTSRHTYRLNTPLDVSSKQFFRLKVSY